MREYQAFETHMRVRSCAVCTSPKTWSLSSACRSSKAMRSDATSTEKVRSRNTRIMRKEDIMSVYMCLEGCRLVVVKEMKSCGP